MDTGYSASNEAGVPDIWLLDIRSEGKAPCDQFDLNIGTVFDNLVFIHCNSPLANFEY